MGDLIFSLCLTSVLQLKERCVYLGITDKIFAVEHVCEEATWQSEGLLLPVSSRPEEGLQTLQD